jgi:hypothetical protein
MMQMTGGSLNGPRHFALFFPSYLRMTDTQSPVITVRAELVENQQTFGWKVTVNLNLADPYDAVSQGCGISVF